MPALAARPCEVYALSPDATAQADLEIAYVKRGAQIAKCDDARQLAVDTFRDQQAATDAVAAKAAERARPWWKLW